MCEKCDELTEKIKLCQRLLWQPPDELTTERLEELLQAYKSQMAGMACKTQQT